MEPDVCAAPPGGLRLRRVQPLFDRDLGCPLLYDLERCMLLEVPVEHHFHVAQALEAGEPDGELFGWMAGEDLLTYDDGPRRSGLGPWPAPLPPGSLGRVWFAEDAVHCHPIATDAETVLAAVGALLDGTEGRARCVVHLVVDGDLAQPQVLRRVIAGSRRLGRRCGRPVSLELTTDGRGLSPATARFLADHRVTVRLTGGSPELVESLLGFLGNRLTLCAILDTGERLLDLWQRAARLGVERLHATKVVERASPGPAVVAAELRQYRRDLFDVADDTFEALVDGRIPRPLFEPLVGVVRRHLSGRAAAVGAAGSAGYFGLLARGGIYPLLAPLSGAGDLRQEMDALGSPGVCDAAQAADSCSGCWARSLCARGRDGVAGPRTDRPAPRGDRCELWRSEIEVGLLLYGRLGRSGSASFLGLADGRGDSPSFDPYTPPAIPASC